jgi:N-acyl homoserine lactone hydrolase
MPRISQLHLASVELPTTHPAADLGHTGPVHGFLIDHPDGPILFDTGVGFDNRFIDDLYDPTRVAIDVALSECGVGLDDVVAVVNSHLHFDHCGQNPALFDGPTVFFAQQAELDAVTKDEYYTDRRWALCPSDQQRAVSGDEEIADGVTILATPGHTAGHQSLLVTAGDRHVVIGGQVAWEASELRAEVASTANVDDVPELQRAAVESIRRINALRPGSVYLSHCDAHHADDRPD